MSWTVETLNELVDEEIAALPADIRARFVYISGLIEEFGLNTDTGAVRETPAR